MTIAIIGATGQLGGHAINALLDRNVAPGDILALGRDSDRLAELAVRGLRTATVDLDDITATTATLTGIESLLLISVGGPGQGLEPRRNAVTAARTAGVRHLVYTSALHAPTTTLVLAAEHKATEDVITSSGIPATFLRNGWYTENHEADFRAAQQRGVIANSVGTGRIATATRADYAEAAAVVLTTPGHQGKVYELSGDTAWNFTDFAATASDVLGSPVRYEALSPADEQEQLRNAGLDDATIGFMSILNANIAADSLADTTGDLAGLIGHPTQPLADTMRTWL